MGPVVSCFAGRPRAFFSESSFITTFSGYVVVWMLFRWHPPPFFPGPLLQRLVLPAPAGVFCPPPPPPPPPPPCSFFFRSSLLLLDFPFALLRSGSSFLWGERVFSLFQLPLHQDFFLSGFPTRTSSFLARRRFPLFQRHYSSAPLRGLFLPLPFLMFFYFFPPSPPPALFMPPPLSRMP